MLPLTERRPKHLLEVGGVAFLEHQIGKLAAAGVGHVVLATSYHADLFFPVLGDGSRYGVRLTYVTEDEPLGTGGAIRNAAEALAPEPERAVVVLNGDVLSGPRPRRPARRLRAAPGRAPGRRLAPPGRGPRRPGLRVRAHRRRGPGARPSWRSRTTRSRTRSTPGATSSVGGWSRRSRPGGWSRSSARRSRAWWPTVPSSSAGSSRRTGATWATPTRSWRRRGTSSWVSPSSPAVVQRAGRGLGGPGRPRGGGAARRHDGGLRRGGRGRGDRAGLGAHGRRLRRRGRRGRRLRPRPRSPRRGGGPGARRGRR